MGLRLISFMLGLTTGVTTTLLYYSSKSLISYQRKSSMPHPGAHDNLSNYYITY